MSRLLRKNVRQCCLTPAIERREPRREYYGAVPFFSASGPELLVDICGLINPRF
jgi:hypothetical protein